MQTIPEQGFDEWGILELMGHRKLAGRIREVQVAGCGMLRIDIPGQGEALPSTQYYHPSAVYGITPTSEAIARGVAEQTPYIPVSRWDLPERLRPRVQPEAVEDRNPVEVDLDVEFDPLPPMEDGRIPCPECGEPSDLIGTGQWECPACDHVWFQTQEGETT